MTHGHEMIEASMAGSEDIRREVRPGRHSKKKAEVSNNKFSLCLTIKKIEDIFMAIRGSKPPRRPEEKRSRKIQKN